MEYGNPTEGLSKKDIVDYVIQRHKQRNREHLDLRLGTPESGMYSWAIPRGRLPARGRTNLAIQTKLHDPNYNTYFGTYGRGRGFNQVDRVALGKANITRITPKTISFRTDNDGSCYTLIHTGGSDGKSWQLLRRKINDSGENTYNSTSFSAENDEDAINRAISGDFKAKGIEKSASNLPKIRVSIIGDSNNTKAKAIIDVALSEKDKRIGLSKRNWVGKGRGMLFPEVSSFWMRDVLVPLDIIFVNNDNIIVDLAEMAVESDNDNLKLYRSSEPSAYAIEFAGNWLKENKINKGDTVVFA